MARLAVIGASWGGMDAVARVLRQIEADNRLAIAVAQHRSPDTDGILVQFLGRHSTLSVVEADDKDVIEPGRVYVAPADYHLFVEGGTFALSTEGAVRFSRPSIDLLFESAAEAYGEELVAVVLTGANDDGCRGVLAVKEAGGLTIAQDPSTAERPEMPEGAIGSGAIDLVLPLDAIAVELNRLGAAERSRS
ncbi:MAG: cheB 1 [Acidimicrobiales bacterium]|jgi:two-component system chemotaxis response regulator CheB|nr:cheB 1 [Acidimicrobiales bacterium]